MEKEQGFRLLTDEGLDIVTGGAKTMVEVDDTKMAQGGLKMEIEGEEVILQNDDDKGFYCVVNGKEYRFTNDEIMEMLHRQLNG